MTMKQDANLPRRDFLKTAAATAGLSILPATALRAAAANEKIQLGLIGCGGRGQWIANLFEQHANVKIVAVHDYFQDKADQAGEKFAVPKERRYIGLDGYKEMLAGDIEAVAIESPPAFHPQQALDAINAGKHVYLAKPVANDTAGCNMIIDAGKLAADKKLNFLVDFQTRNNEFFRGAAQRVHEGLIGAPVCGQTFYHAGRLRPKVEAHTQVARLRNWFFDTPLSGDIIVEQNIHVLDVMNWYMQGHPVKAVGTGGRKSRTEYGDCWDHFVVTYTYPNGELVDFGSTQFLYGYSDLCIRLFCQEGTVDSHYGGDVSIRGKSQGWKGGKTPTIYQDGAVNNIKDFSAAIAAGECLNNAEESAHSTLTCVLGRTAAYTGEVATWDAMMAANESLALNLDLPEDGPQRQS